MAVSGTRRLGELDTGLVLAPERYDPRRVVAEGAGVPLGEIARVVREQVGRNDLGTAYRVLDTSDAREGVIFSRKETVAASAIGSAKNRAAAGDVIISRLRPYLRQVALVDEGMADGVELVCSTEFYVLRTQTPGESIAFLVPFLLSEPVQRILSVSQEGGHHPRFNRDTLTMLRVPDDMLACRRDLSKEVEETVQMARRADRGLREIVARFADPPGSTRGIEMKTAT